MRNLKPSYNGVLIKLVESKLKLAKTTSVKADGFVMSKTRNQIKHLRIAIISGAFLSCWSWQIEFNLIPKLLILASAKRSPCHFRARELRGDKGEKLLYCLPSTPYSPLPLIFCRTTNKMPINPRIGSAITQSGNF